MFFALALDIDEDVIKVHYHENIKLFCQDLVDLASLESSQCVSQSEGHNLVFKVAIAGFQSRLLFVALPNPHLIVGIG